MSKKLFSIIFYSGVVLVCIIFLPSLIMPRSISIFGGKILGHWSKFCLNFFLSTNIKIIGKENILSDDTVEETDPFKLDEETDMSLEEELVKTKKNSITSASRKKVLIIG